MKNKAYNEVLEILKHIPLKDYLKIPREEISKLMLEKDDDYEFTYNTKKKFSEQNISKEAFSIFTRLYVEYIANDYEKEGIMEILEINEKITKKDERS